MSVLLVRAGATGGIRTHVNALQAELDQRDIVSTLCVLTLRQPRTLWATFRSVKTASVTHAHGLKAGAFCALLRPKRLIVTVHNVSFEGQTVWRRSITRVLEWIVVTRAQVVVGTSLAIEDELRKLAPFGCGTKILTVRPFGPVLVAHSTRDAVRSKWHLSSRDRVVLCFARLHEQKDVLTLLQAWKLVLLMTAADDAPRYLVLVGDGPQRELVATAIVDGGLGQSVVCESHTNDVASYYNASDVVVCTSIWESGPLVVLEAALSAKAIVTTVVGNVGEYLVDGESAWFVAKRDAPQIARALNELLGDSNRAAELGVAAQERSTAWFNRAALVDETIALYSS